MHIIDSADLFTPPNGWIRIPSEVAGVRQVNVEPAQDGFRANLVDTAWLVATQSLGKWISATEVMFAATMPSYELVDLEKIQISGHAGARRLATYQLIDGPRITLDQWFLIDGQAGYTLSATCLTECHSELRDAFEACASTWRPIAST